MMSATFLAPDMRLLTRILDEAGIDSAAVLQQAGIDPALAEQPRARCPLGRVVAAWVRASEITDDPDLGLKAARFYRPTDFHGLAVSFLASSDLGTALARVARYHAVVNTALSTRLVRSQDRIDLFCSTVDAGDRGRRMLEDARAAILVSLARDAVSGPLDPVAVDFTYAEPADRSALEAMLRCPLRFGAPEWRLSFRAEDAARPFQASNRDIAVGNDAILDGLVRSLRQGDIVSRVKLAMVEQLASGSPSEHSIARAVSMSARSLQRRLATEGTSFTELLATVRRELAERYVQDPALPVTEISYMLGFADVSSFSRAFKRWTGLSPAAIRRSLTA